MNSRALILFALLPLAAAGCRRDDSLAERRLDAAALEAERAALRAELDELRAQRQAAIAASYQIAPQATPYQTASYSAAPDENSADVPADLVVDSIPSAEAGAMIGGQASTQRPTIYIAPALRRPDPEVLELREREIARRERQVRQREAAVAQARTAPVGSTGFPVIPVTKPNEQSIEAKPASVAIEPSAPVQPSPPSREPVDAGSGVSAPQSGSSMISDVPAVDNGTPADPSAVPPPGRQ